MPSSSARSLPTLPIIGITANLDPSLPSPPASVMMTYVDAVARAGGCAVLLPPEPSWAADHARLCDAIVFTGGNDPAMEGFGVPTHAKANPMHPRRQAYELALLTALDSAPSKPVLGICLGMQLMSLHAGGTMDQHLPDTLGPASAAHWDAEHDVRAAPAHQVADSLRDLILGGRVLSKHRQAISNSGTLAVIASAADGVIEAVADVGRPFYVGVQWHPERTADDAMGAAIFRRLIAAATERVSIKEKMRENTQKKR